MNSDRQHAPALGPSPRPSRTFAIGAGRGEEGAAERSRRARFRMLAALATFGLAAIVAGRVLWEGEVADPTPPRTIEPFALRDAAGTVHEPGQWRDAKAVVLFVIGAEGPLSDEFAPEMRRLSATYAPEGVRFFGVHPDPSMTPERAARHAEERVFPFPVLLDPAHELVGELGVTATPEAAVLDARRHVRYVGRIDDRASPDGPRGGSPGCRDLEQAIVAVLRGLPDVPDAAEVSGRALPEPKPPVAPGEEITFHEHVAPILWNRCAGCHRPGEVGPFPLLTYKDAAKRADFLREVTESREMPPWPAVHGYGDFLDPGRLSRRELAILARWADDGAPEGDPRGAGEPPTFPEGWQLGTPDLVATMPEPFVIPADAKDIYRAFVIPLPLGGDAAVAAVEFRRGNRRVVHHARFYVDPTGESRRRDEAEPGPGFESFGGGDILKPGLGAWVPGLIPSLPPPDVGKVVRKGSDLVVLIHYHGTGKEEVDRSSVGLFFCKAPPRRSTVTLSLSSDKIDIPPGEARHRIALTSYLKADAHAISVLPHGHFLLREVSLRATLPGGQVVPMLWVDDWDFNWQGQYHFARPVPLPKGTRLDVVAYYDNSEGNPANPHSPPRRVKLGWASTDEMLGVHVQLIPDDPESHRIFEKDIPFGL